MKPRFPKSACGQKGQRHRTLREMVDEYILQKRPLARAELWTFCRQPFEEALERAALARDERGKRFSHERRFIESQLSEARKILLHVARQLHRCDSFEQLHKLIKKHLNGIRGLRELYYYDTALRIGASLHLMPERVYLHRGTRDGARALGLDCRADSLDTRDLPKALAVLEPYEVEDFLCIYKAELRPEMR